MVITGLVIAIIATMLRQQLRYPWQSLKTNGSERCIPLVGIAKWAAEGIVENGMESKIASPRYCNEVVCNANSASNGLNKWLHQTMPK